MAPCPCADLVKPQAGLALSKLLTSMLLLVISQSVVGWQLGGALGAVEELLPSVLGPGVPGEPLHVRGEDAPGEGAGQEGTRGEMFLHVGD